MAIYQPREISGINGAYVFGIKGWTFSGLLDEVNVLSVYLLTEKEKKAENKKSSTDCWIDLISFHAVS